jgi:hypothetical protein
MTLRYWGERGLTADSFAHLVDRSAAGIRTTALVEELRQRGWAVSAMAGSAPLARRELDRGRPVIALIEERPARFHYVVVVGWHDRAVIFHDPARAPFRVTTVQDFERRWASAASWMLMLAPSASRDQEAVREQLVTDADAPFREGTTCEQLVNEGIRLAQSKDLDGAERALTSALACPGPAALRELAGLRLLQRRWEDMGDLAAAALADDPGDEHSWQLLATSRFLRDERLQALDAWNRVGAPRVDLVRVDGLVRTAHRVVERTLDLGTGDLLTAESFARARRRLAELPAAATTRLEYVPVPSGLAELRAAVSERSLLPRGRLTYIALAASASATRQLSVTTGSLSGGGEQLFSRWRFWPRREAYGVGVRAPAPWGGVWTLEGHEEHQAFTDPSLAAALRRRARLEFSDWASGRFHWNAGGGVDRWEGRGVLANAGGAMGLVTADERWSIKVGADLWVGQSSFGAGRLSVRGRSSTDQIGTVLVGFGGVQTATRAMPMDIRPAGDTGPARETLLRAHPLIEDGRLRGDRTGLSLINGSIEVQRWRRPVGPVRFGGAAFVDSAVTARRLSGKARRDVDAGIGARIGVAGWPGLFRVDFAKGLRDGATVLSVALDSDY